MSNRDYLESLHTKQLLKLLKEARGCYGYYTSEDELISDYGYSMNDLKAILATREHIPNKLEAKRIRKEKLNDKRNK